MSAPDAAACTIDYPYHEHPLNSVAQLFVRGWEKLAIT
jgi:hypothetical protein